MTKPIHSLALASAMALAANMGLAEVTLSISSDNNQQTHFSNQLGPKSC